MNVRNEQKTSNQIDIMLRDCVVSIRDFSYKFGGGKKRHWNDSTVACKRGGEGPWRRNEEFEIHPRIKAETEKWLRGFGERGGRCGGSCEGGEEEES